MSNVRQLHDMPVIPSNYTEALFEGFLAIAASHHPANIDFVPAPFDAEEASEAEADSEHLTLVDAGLLDEEPESEADAWPPVHEPVAESDLAWQADLTDAERWSE